MEPSLSDLAVSPPLDFPAVGWQTWAAEHPMAHLGLVLTGLVGLSVGLGKEQ